MQFHLDGFRPGDPAVADAVAALPPDAPLRPLPADVDAFDELAAFFDAFMAVPS